MKKPGLLCLVYCLSFFSLFCAFGLSGVPVENRVDTEDLARKQTIEVWQRATAIVPGSIETVSKRFTDCEEILRIFPLLDKSTRLSREECFLQSKFGGQTFWLRLKIHKQTFASQNHIRIDTNTIQTNLSTFKSRCELTQLHGNKSRVTLSMIADVPNVPTTIGNFWVRRTIDRALSILKST